MSVRQRREVQALLRLTGAVGALIDAIRYKAYRYVENTHSIRHKSHRLTQNLTYTWRIKGMILQIRHQVANI